MAGTLDAVYALLVIAMVVLCAAIARRQSRPPLPPGPPGLPLIGNALQFDAQTPLRLTFKKWTDQYGDIVHVSSFGRPVIILSSARAINDLMEKRGTIYSDRPRGVMATELSGFGTLLTAIPYGEQMRISRKMLNDTLGQRNAAQWHALHERNARVCASQLVIRPQEWNSHIVLMITKAAFKAAIGLEVHSLDDHFVQIAERATTNLQKTFEPGAFLVDVLPVLKHIPSWFPGAGFQRLAATFRESAALLRNEPYELVKTNLAQGKAENSILATFLQENSDVNPAMEEVCKDVTAVIYAGTVDSIHTAMLWFFFAMVSWPELQKKAQAELDAVLEVGDLPAMTDRSKLPYVEALLQEIYRWHPIVPLGVPHSLAKDDLYRGYHLPAGSTIVVNAWALSQNHALYPEPERFNPERFIDGAKDGFNPDPRLNGIVFGAGRRTCPGQYFADDMLFIAIATILATVNIERAPDKNGDPIIPQLKAHGNVTSKPHEFACRVTPRSSETAAMFSAV